MLIAVRKVAKKLRFNFTFLNIAEANAKQKSTLLIL